MGLKKRLKAIGVTKRVFDEMCAEAACQCPQRPYCPYVDLGDTPDRYADVSWEDLFHYWNKSRVLWRTGYSKYLPDSFKDVFRWYRRE